MNRAVYLGSLLLVFASGGAALAHELLWTRRLIDLVGAAGDATARVLGCFFLGLALGGMLAMRIVRRTRRPWRTAALLEAGVALLAVPILYLPSWTAWLWPALGTEQLTSWPGSLAKLLISGLAVVPPAVLMGIFLPVVARAVLSGEYRLGREGIWLYAVNTAGGVAGLLLTIGFGLGNWGVTGTMLAAMATNVAVAVMCLGLDRFTASAAEESSAPNQDASNDANMAGKLPIKTALLCAFASGAGVLACEMLAVHLTAHVVPSALQATSAVLATVILVLSLAALLVPVLVRRIAPAVSLLPAMLALAAVTTAAAPLLFVRQTDALRTLGDSPSPLWFVLRIMLLVAASLGPALLMTGTVFPLVMAWVGTFDPGGRRWGLLLAANGLGGIVGVELAQGLLMPTVGIYFGLGIVGLGYALLAGALPWLVQSGTKPVWASFVSLFAVVLIAIAMPTWLADLPTLGANAKENGYRALWSSTGRDGVVTITQHDALGRAIMLPGGYTLGSTSATLRQRRQTHLPLLLHPQPKSVALIALATGITAGGAAAHDAVESLTVIELSGQVVDAARSGFFDDHNAGVLDDPRTRVVVEDGRTFLAASPGRFDVVVGDLFLPWRAGVGRLHSLEHYRAVKESLRPGGLFCQWLPLYDMGRPQAESILATFTRVFPRTHLFRGSFSPGSPTLALIGFRDGGPDGNGPDWNGLADRTSQLHATGLVNDPLMLDPDGLKVLYLGWLTAGDVIGTSINTLGNAEVELGAGQLRMTGDWRAASLRGDRWIEFLHDYVPRMHFSPDVADQRELAQLGNLISDWRWAQRRRDEQRAAELRWQILNSAMNNGPHIPSSLTWLLR